MNTNRFPTILKIGLSLSVLLPGVLDAQINFIRDTYAQNFNALPKSGSVTLENTSNVGQSVELSSLSGWYVAKLGGSGSGDMTMIADDGRLNGGRVYSYGSSDDVERALGMKGSGTHYAAAGVAFENGTNSTITSVTITYTHEIWSVQGTTGSNSYEDRLTFAYGVSGEGLTEDNFLSSDEMTGVPALDAVSSSSRALTGVTDGGDPERSRDGNSDDWRQEVSSSISGIDWKPGEILYLRWQDDNTGGFDAGHGIEDFEIKAGGTISGRGARLPDIGVKVDGEFSDWKRQKDLHHDPAGDNQSESIIDIITLGGVVSADGLSLYIKAAEPFVLSESTLKIYIDADGDAETGNTFGGLGSELMVDFSVSQDDLRFFPARAIFYPEQSTLPAGEVIAESLPNGMNPTSTHPESDEFEILIPLASLRGLEPGGRVGILVRDGVGEFVPDIGETLYFDVPPNIRPEPELEKANFEKDDPDDIRIASYNVLANGPQDSDKAAAFGRQLAATKPDIINFQELYQASASWAINFVNEWLPLEEGQWHARKSNDCITVSRFPIKGFWPVDGNLVVHIDTMDAWGFDSVFVNAHTPAHVENQEPRIRETSSLMLLLRRLMNGTEPSAPEGPFTTFVTGDLNANSPKIELSAFRTGIFADDTYQSLNYWPDNYNLPLVDTAPRHTHTNLPRLFTWRGLESGNTQRLDYIYYQQSRLTKKNAFVIDTESMPASFLEENNLEPEDSRASDHLLMIADFKKREVDYVWDAQDIESSGWIFSQWMGWMYQYTPNIHYSPLHGIMASKPSQQGVWFWDDQLGWLFSRSGLYPYTYRHESQTWIYFYLSDEQPRYYYDFQSDEWKS